MLLKKELRDSRRENMKLTLRKSFILMKVQAHRILFRKDKPSWWDEKWKEAKAELKSEWKVELQELRFRMQIKFRFLYAKIKR